MNAARLLRVTSIAIGLSLVCSCVPPSLRIPVGVVPMNDRAGTGDVLLIPLRLNDQEERLFILDTGSPVTLIDPSCAAIVGGPVGTNRVHSIFGADPALRYRSPSIYLGDTQLRTGPWVIAWDLKRVSSALGRFNGSSHQIAGVLGMDCLRHYCIQLDFPHGIVRFLEPDQAMSKDLGAAYGLGKDRQGCPTVEGDFDSFSRFTVIDTGCIDQSKTNTVGLNYLSRYSVTFNFPKRTMYVRHPRLPWEPRLDPPDQ